MDVNEELSYCENAKKMSGWGGVGGWSGEGVWLAVVGGVGYGGCKQIIEGSVFPSHF